MSAGSLLLVDDEAALLDLLKKYLERHQFKVCGCTDPVAALQLVEAAPADYWLVVADLTLPGMSGEELIERIRAFSPSIPAILVSGYAYEPRLPGVEFLQKPFLPKMLVELMERIRGTRAKASGARTAKHRS